MRRVYLLAALMLAAAVYLGVRGSPGWALAALAASGCLQTAGIFATAQRRAAVRFLAWVALNQPLLARGKADYAGHEITGETRLVRFQAAVSYVLGTISIPSRYYIQGVHRTGLARLGFTLVTLGLGWWGIPWGPRRTLQALARNLRGGERQTVSDLLQRMQTMLEQEAVRSS